MILISADISVTTRWPDLSPQVADRMIELVNRFNLERRQSQASGERDRDDSAGFARIWKETREDLRRLWRRVRRAVGRA